MNDAPFSIVVSKESSLNVFEVQGSLIINHIENIYNELKSKIDFSKKHIIEVDNVEGIDLTFIQLLLSLKKEFGDYGTDFEIKLNLSEEQEHLLKNSGFENQFRN